jgi:hypothetical protein
MVYLRGFTVAMPDDFNARLVKVVRGDFFYQRNNPIECQTPFGLDNDELSPFVIWLAELAFLVVSREVDHF